ncbi:carboxypeptidase-like regulatory domain-containing protein [Mucilaginibacter humi]|uniref:carboxypeptidase-like regulatory domain-containing protein n=1 Tax=Mucilaginibacter humi TaxID=2732510 RepID=UPI001FEC80A0|nr:carboxypeptidase-like regulatory domain-containing protein [Mucilaginibacter humi]
MRQIYQRLLIVCCMMLSVAALAQQPGRTITGNVKDEKNQPLPGVSVLIAGTNTGVMTDVNGNYSQSKR